MTAALSLMAAVAAPRRTAPEASDIFLFAVAVAAVWLVRRGLRKRFGRRADD